MTMGKLRGRRRRLGESATHLTYGAASARLWSEANAHTLCEKAFERLKTTQKGLD